VCAVHLFLALQHLNHVAFGFPASKPNPEKLREYRVFLGDQWDSQVGEYLLPSAPRQLAWYFFAYVKVDPYSRLSIQGLEQALLTNGIQDGLTVDVVVHRQTFHEGFGLRAVDRQLDDQIDVLSESWLAVERSGKASGEVVAQS